MAITNIYELMREKNVMNEVMGRVGNLEMTETIPIGEF